MNRAERRRLNRDRGTQTLTDATELTQPIGCFACGVLTDSVLVLDGRAEWQLEELTALGVPEDSAASTIERCRTTNPNRFVIVQLCALCADITGIPVSVPTFSDLGLPLKVVAESCELIDYREGDENFAGRYDR